MAQNSRTAPAARSASAADIDIAIIGAGPGGLYSAWRLLQDENFKSQRICLFDAAPRVGGRVLSVILPEVPYVTELGAMRYLSDQILIKSLVEDHLQLETAPFVFETTGYLLRGKSVSRDLFQRPALIDGDAANYNPNVPYNLSNDEQFMSPFDLIVLAIQRALRNVTIAPEASEAREAEGMYIQELHEKLKALDNNSPEQNLVTYLTSKEWRLLKRYGTLFFATTHSYQPLYKIGFWDLVEQYLTPEGYNLAQDGSGYQSILSMWSAADAILWYLSDFASGPYKTIVTGMGELTKRLHDDIMVWAKPPESTQVSVCNTGWHLQKLTAQQTKHGRKFRLTFRLGPASTTLPSVTKSITAGKVILALTQPALKELEIDGLEIEAGDSREAALSKFHLLLDSVTANPLCKLLVVYDKTWWVDKNEASCFKVLTDLPLRQIYHFGKDRQCDKLPTKAERGDTCILLAYSDARFAEYWRNLQSTGTSRDNKYYNQSYRKVARDKWGDVEPILREYGTHSAVLARVQHQLRKVSGKNVPLPNIVLFKHWSRHPYHAGWHSWNMGYPSWLVAKQMVKPFLNAELYTCGEAFSSEQGWIEGALKSAERVLEQLGISAPTWVDQEKFEEQKELWL